MRALLAVLCMLTLTPSLARADLAPPDAEVPRADAQVPTAGLDAGTHEDHRTGCSLAPGGPAREAGALLFAGAIAAFVLLGRRKRGT